MEYFVLRVCERLGLTEREFLKAEYEQQMRWLAFESVRQRERAEERKQRGGS